MNLACEKLVADVPQAGGHVNHIVAQTNVVIDFVDTQGHTNHATATRRFMSIRRQGGVTNETVTLTGNAQMENAEGTLTGEPIVWDRQNNHLSASNQKMIFHQNLSGAGGGHEHHRPSTKPIFRPERLKTPRGPPNKMETAASSANGLLLTTEHLVKAYHGRRVVDDVSISVAAGEIVGSARPERRGQDDHVQHGCRPGETGCGRGEIPGPAASPVCPCTGGRGWASAI